MSQLWQSNLEFLSFNEYKLWFALDFFGELDFRGEAALGDIMWDQLRLIRLSLYKKKLIQPVSDQQWNCANMRPETFSEHNISIL